MIQLPLSIFKKEDLPDIHYKSIRPNIKRSYNFSWLPIEKRKIVEELYPIWFAYSQLRLPFTNRGRKSGSKISKQKVKLFAGRQKAPCFYCGILLVFKKATLDHVIPWSFGGTNRLTNLLITCGKCNGSRDNTPFDKWMNKLGMADLIDEVLQRQPSN